MYYMSTRRWKYLHVAIVEARDGEVPDGFHVHHVNGNPLDNDPANLIALTPKMHYQVHLKMGTFDDWRASGMSQHLERIRRDAARWHGSDEGLAWHAEHGRKSWENRVATEKVCGECGKNYTTFFPKRSQVCSPACQQRLYRRTRRYAFGKTCPICKVEFRALRKTQVTCGHQCAAILRQQQRADSV